jgi:hypothetical protein
MKVDNVQIKLLGTLQGRLLRLPKSLQKIILVDLEAAAANRLNVMERVNCAN